MEHFRSFFDLFGKRKKAADGKNKHGKHGKVKNKLSRGSSSKLKTTAAKKGKSQSSGGKIQPRSSQRNQRTETPRAVVSSTSATVFAPRLVHVASKSDEAEFDQSWLSIKSIAGGGYHCAVYLIHCAEHGKVAFTKPSAQQAMWLPFAPIPPNQAWEETGLTCLLIILSGANTELFASFKSKPPFAEFSLLEVFDVQLPHTMDIITRLTWYVQLDPERAKNEHFQCCQNTEKLLWVDIKDITDQNLAVLEFLWDNQPIDKTAVFKQCYELKTPIVTSFEEYNLEMAFHNLPRTPPADDEQQLLISANLTEKDVERLYGDFLEHCYPCTTMAQHSFNVYMTKYGLKHTDDRLCAFFRAFSINNDGVISFPELLIGLACIDSKSMHNETRAKFVLRYYDVYHRGYLTEDDIRLMIQDIQGEGVSEDTVEAKLLEILQQVSTDEESKTKKRTIPQRRFLAAIGNHTIRGTSKLCRIGKPICTAIAGAIFARAQRNLEVNPQIGSVVERPYDGTCIGCRTKRPLLEDSLVKLTADGFVAEQVQLSILKSIESSSSGTSLQKSKSKLSERRSERNNSQEGQRSDQKARKRQSSVGSSTSLGQVSLSSVDGIESSTLITGQDNEEAKAVALKLISQIRQFAPRKGNTRQPLGLLSESEEDRQHFVDQMEIIERAVGPILRQRRCMPVPSPAVIIGVIYIYNVESNIMREYCIS